MFVRNITVVQGDTSELADLDKLYDVIKKEKGHLDILFANAGIYELAPLGSITEQHYDSLFDGGSIILNASVVSIKGFPAASVYSATKAAFRSFARTWTVDLKVRKIRVNTLSPGPVETSVFNNIFSTKGEKQKFFIGWATRTLMGSVGTADEIAKVTVYTTKTKKVNHFVTVAEIHYLSFYQLHQKIHIRKFDIPSKISTHVNFDQPFFVTENIDPRSFRNFILQEFRAFNVRKLTKIYHQMKALL